MDDLPPRPPMITGAMRYESRAYMNTLLFTSAMLLLGSRLMADPVPVRHTEGRIHGFLVLRDLDDNVLASELTIPLAVDLNVSGTGKSYLARVSSDIVSTVVSRTGPTVFRSCRVLKSRTGINCPVGTAAPTATTVTTSLGTTTTTRTTGTITTVTTK